MVPVGRRPAYRQAGQTGAFDIVRNCKFEETKENTNGGRYYFSFRVAN